MPSMHIEYKVNQPITEQQFIALLQGTTLGERRPVQDIAAIKAMLKHGNLLVTAWLNDELVGVARSLTDFHFCCYLSDLAVLEPLQSQGIGKELIRRTKEMLEPQCLLILLSAPQAVSYYPKIGMSSHPSAWTLKDINDLK